MSKLYSTGSVTVATSPTSVAGYDGGAVTFQATITGGTKATFLVKFTKE
jgi:hypothetical protein